MDDGKTRLVVGLAAGSPLGLTKSSLGVTLSMRHAGGGLKSVTPSGEAGLVSLLGAEGPGQVVPAL